MKRTILALLALLFSQVTHADAVIADASAFTAGTDVSNSYPGVVLSTAEASMIVNGLVVTEPLHLVSENTTPVYTTGTYFSHAGGDIWSAGQVPGPDIALRMDFTQPTSSVAAVFVPDDTDTAVLQIYDSDDNLLAEVLDRKNTPMTLSLNSAGVPISYALATFGDTGRIASLSYFQSPPRPGILDTLEDIGPDGTQITSRTIGGVTVSISTASGKLLEARTYFDASPNAFGGAGGGANAPAVPGNVSLTRFISTVDRAFTPDNWAFGQVAPIIFDFSSPIQLFGLTTIDLLEGNGSLTFRAYDAGGNIVAEQTRTGPQGGSGLDLDWQVAAADIVQAQLLGTISDSVGGYGIDDLILAAAPQIVSIDIKPGRDPDCKGAIPVSILGSDTLDVTQIDQTTLIYGGLTVRERGNGSLSCSIQDMNGDGYADLVCQYQDTLTEGTLTGELLDGTAIEGTDTVCVVH